MRPPHSEEFGQQVPHSDNSAADATANHALDNGTFMEVMLAETVCFPSALQEADPPSIGILFSFDVAAHSNPGKASYGVCGGGVISKAASLSPVAYWYKEDADLELIQTMLRRRMAWHPL